MSAPPSIYQQAKALAAAGPLSIALLHRNLGIGYGDAARLMARLKRAAKK